MSRISFRHKGDFSKTEKFFNALLKIEYLNVLERYGKAGFRPSPLLPRKTVERRHLRGIMRLPITEKKRQSCSPIPMSKMV